MSRASEMSRANEMRLTGGMMRSAGAPWLTRDAGAPWARRSVVPRWGGALWVGRNAGPRDAGMTWSRDGGMTFTDVASACARHPVLCTDIGIDGLRFWREVQFGWQDKKWSPEAWGRLRALIMKVIKLIMKDPENMRDLLKRLNLDPVWYPCLGITADDLLSVDRFEAAMYRFLYTSAGIERAELERLKRESKSSLDSYVDAKLAQLERLLIDCKEKSDSAACHIIRTRINPSCPLVRWLSPNP